MSDSYLSAPKSRFILATPSSAFEVSVHPRDSSSAHEVSLVFSDSASSIASSPRFRLGHKYRSATPISLLAVSDANLLLAAVSEHEPAARRCLPNRSCDFPPPATAPSFVGPKMDEDLEQQIPNRRQKRRTGRSVRNYGPPPPELHPGIAHLRGIHRAAHPDLNIVLETSSHLRMFREWPIRCPRFSNGLRMLGLDCVTQLQYIRLDQHLLTALVERWSPKTNTFHLPVGEMSITLQDVAMILCVNVDGPALIGGVMIGEGKRWQSWPDCCNELLGQHPEDDHVYHDPIDPNIESTFEMGQAKSKTCVPLRWLRWLFYRESYAELTEVEFQWQKVTPVYRKVLPIRFHCGLV